MLPSRLAVASTNARLPNVSRLTPGLVAVVKKNNAVSHEVVEAKGFNSWQRVGGTINSPNPNANSNPRLPRVCRNVERRKKEFFNDVGMKRWLSNNARANPKHAKANVPWLHPLPASKHAAIKRFNAPGEPKTSTPSVVEMLRKLKEPANVLSVTKN